MATTFSNRQRNEYKNTMKENIFDVLVIGGGITGAGIALDAQSRGMRTALIDMQDFAAGTSSRSTKLVHGGLRYLKQFEVKMVAEVGKERAIVYENAPHVTTPEWMLLPFYQGGTFGAFSTSIGLRVYDFLAGVKRKERRVMFSPEETLKREPLLKKAGLKGGGYYVEYRTDDARLTMEVMKKAVEYGTTALNYVKATQLLYTDGKLTGVEAMDVLTGETFTVCARKIVNAAGPWVDTLRELDGSKKGKTLRLTKGVHLVFDQSRFPLKQAVYFDTPDGRMVFAIPRDGKTYIGTTDTDYKTDPVHPTMSEADRTYILAAANDMFPGLKLTAGDVESSWAGVRPLIYQEGKSPSEISRRDEIFRSDSGLITIAGGKLTGYRKMAETVTDMVARELAGEGAGTYGPSKTKHMALSGGDFGGSDRLPAFIRDKSAELSGLGIPAKEAELLVRRYGTNIDKVAALLPQAEAERGNMPLVLYAELLYAVDYELAAKPADFLIRRTGALFFNIQLVQAWYRETVQAMGRLLGHTEEQIQRNESEMESYLRDAVVPS
ncbi:glycerol-3-phosphate dehydrogenase/oxidase [Paenibacillus gansuensis]|uniref:Glycerol-3-phosphate dehydrogenase n=1 Tax=Paenibacillus gansuensis TaxID=306542 RepID=A0ABW5PEL1_9BACL